MDEKKEEASTEQKSTSGGQAAPRLELLLMQEAHGAMEKGNYRNAADTFENLLKRFSRVLDDGQQSVIHSELGTLWYWLGDYESSRRHAEASLAFGDNDQAFNILGKMAVAQYKFAEARGYFSKIPENNPARPLGMCLICLKLRDTRGAETFLSEARGKISSKNAEFRVYNAYLLLLKGDAPSAVAQSRNVLKDADCDPSLLLFLAEIFMTAGHYGEAKSTVAKISSRCPEHDAAHAILAFAAYAEENWDSAESFAEAAVRLNPYNAYAKTVLMKVASRNGSYAKAEEIGRNILEDSPEYSLAHANLGDVYFNEGRYELAELEYEQTQQLMNADTKGAKLRKARVKFIAGDFSGAAEILKHLVDGMHTYYDDAMCDLVLCYDKLGNAEKREEMLDKMAYRRSFYHRTEKILQDFGS